MSMDKLDLVNPKTVETLSVRAGSATVVRADDGAARNAFFVAAAMVSPTLSAIGQIVNPKGIDAALQTVNAELERRDPKLAGFLRDAGDNVVKHAQTLGVAADAVLGELRNAFGKEVTEVSAPSAGKGPTSKDTSLGR